MPLRSTRYSIVKGSRHQGGMQPATLFHVIDETGVIVCGAIPRQTTRPAPASKTTILRGLYKPLCPDCRAMVRAAMAERKV